MAEVKQKGNTLNNLKQHALTAISYLIPIVVAGGFLLAIGSLMGGALIEDFSTSWGFADTLYTMGSKILGMLPVVIGVGIAFSIADKPGIASGFLVGLISILMNAGFIGGFIGGYIAGYITLYLKNHLHVPSWAEGLKPLLIIPLISCFLVGMIMFYVLGTPISAFTAALENYIRGLDRTQTLMFGLIIGVLSGIDYGGPINKVVYAFLLSLQAEGINEPMAVLMLASMVTPFGLTMMYPMQKIFHKNVFSRTEVETLKTAFPMGVCMITEGCYPIIFNHLLPCIISTGIGAGVGGALSMSWGCASPVPHGGLFAMVTMTNPFGWLAALLIGSLVFAVVLFCILKPVDKDSVIDVDSHEEAEINMNDIKIS
ncbi:MAG: PTS fructose transporter subunit IIC [Catenisphaera adipataccumulans]|jgi:PTS system fructose-specific IIC component|uniref:PTS fructose transporter subunit IIC n=1 Tax=Catenisphaera adipataccumulans TaxID=700500 RepID=UPI003D8A3C29